MEDKHIKKFIEDIINQSETNEDDNETIEKTKTTKKNKKINAEPELEIEPAEEPELEIEPTEQPIKKHKQKVKVYREVKPRRRTRHERSPAQIEAFKKAQELRLEKSRKRNEEKKIEIENIMTKVYETREQQKAQRRDNARKQYEETKLMTVLNKMSKEKPTPAPAPAPELPEYYKYF
jgi:hypothetical protein